MIYLDTSAFLKLYVREDGSELVHQTMRSQHDPIPIPDVLQWEFTNALRLKVFWGELDRRTVDRLMVLFDDRLQRGQYIVPEIDRTRLTEDVRRLTAHTQTVGSRTLDVVQVAIALQLEASPFVTFDTRQRELADKTGLVLT